MVKTVFSSIFQCIVILFITVILSVSIEFGLRFFITAKSESDPLKFHPKYLVYANPNVSYEFQRTVSNGGETILSKTNSWGFRGEEFERETDEIRIMVYGDSNIQAVFSEYEDSFSARLETELEIRTGYNFQVINAGVRGYGPDQVLLRMKDEIPVWNPDLVIVHIFAANDFGDIIRDRMFYIDQETGELLHKGISFRDRLVIFAKDLYVKKAVMTIWSAVSNTLAIDARNSDRPRLSKESELEKLERRIDEELKAYFGGPIPREILRDHYDLDIALNPNSDSSQLKIALMEKILRQIKLVADTTFNIPIVFLIQPSSKDISTNVELNYKKLQKISDKYRRENLSKTVEIILEKLDANYVNLYDTFLTDNISPYYFMKYDNHWNDLGQKLASEMMADHILNNYGSVLKP